MSLHRWLLDFVCQLKLHVTAIIVSLILISKKYVVWNCLYNMLVSEAPDHYIAMVEIVPGVEFEIAVEEDLPHAVHDMSAAEYRRYEKYLLVREKYRGFF